MNKSNVAIMNYLCNGSHTLMNKSNVAIMNYLRNGSHTLMNKFNVTLWTQLLDMLVVVGLDVKG